MRKWQRILGCLLAMMLPCCAVAEELLCFSEEGICALTDADGGMIVPPETFDDLFCVAEDALYAAGRSGEAGMRYALCDASGKLLTDFLYEMLDEDAGVLRFRQNGLYGIMDMDGEVLLEAQYTQVVAAADGAYFVLTTNPYDDEADRILLVRPKEEPVFLEIQTACGLTQMNSDRMPLLVPDTERYGYLDGKGNIAIAPELGYAGEFRNGLAAATLNGRFGLLTPEGKWLIQPEYVFLDAGENLAIAVNEENKCMVYSLPDGGVCFDIEAENAEVFVLGNRICVRDAKKLSVYDKDGTVFLEASSEASVTEGAGDELILRDGEWGAECVSVILPDGTRQERRDQHLLPLDEDRYLFMKMNVAAYNSGMLGEIRYSCDYESMRFGIMNSAGEEILPSEAKEVRRLGAYRYLTISPDGLRIVDGDGAVLWSRLTEEE